ncbi:MULTISPECIES: FKBP-type peptidyl-prolyl cis-trans isomerase [Vibrio]|uniref:Peptidyl-prolyl cis-trans isomerase n=1 Tax=Vibrio halioticoli NBRC 102217 TaxID=1219072 RepID=V5F2L8_9VIBR|nr:MULTISPECIES: FKBP-type peptidyl-prolyl cis-trans isomerase [Vibrio]MPW36459.1 FKBP-type peptidyl-prolyl cis-trans isomerase [Vibrio sp. B1Z05]GAD89359.1 FKBP-type peptidyl-prolyl cis-trans isomerase FklB [Vibrio halioticoli NBRC 102217]
MSKFLIPAIVVLLASFMIYRVWTNHKTGKENIAIGQAFLQENGQREGVVTTDSGLQYEVLVKGDGEIHPQPTSIVKVHYHGTLIDGTVFDSTVERDKPIEFPLNRVIHGWQEGLQLMVVGDKFRFFIPSNLAYGKSGNGPIPGSATLIFDVELLDIK